MNHKLSEIDEALAILKRQNIRLGEPVIQEGLGVIIRVNGYMLRSVEILDLKRRGKLNLEGIQEYASEVENELRKNTK